ncbi:3-hydroxyacyl-CoA dehydrogenase [Pseudomonas kairouanensis]|uniref:3-hydroxyacyl-CoA dehydrogenase n=1 Tax=Pseudomonas kairouanensis TaxID=2293832 RepID=A0A4Z0AS57_9PSED|nr:3-hydroxyacyl-CoA dehydrogenase [Pseudomonas kairouanensis]TFY88954.1 3-hydroxyacyl-CoA dehydrogenase [Pseudomonas kairouanensis]
MTVSINTLGLVGTGVMGAGIAQIAAQAGVVVRLFDAREGAAQTARDGLAATFAKLVSKGKINPLAMDAALTNLQVTEALDGLKDCDLVVEAIVENLDAKRGLLKQLEAIVSPTCILATNTSSLSITAIASGCQHPERVAGLHFFNPVPLMRVVEVIDGLATAPQVGDALLALVARTGHRGVRAKDTPGFIVNHAGRAYGTEALKMLDEGIAERGEIDRILRDGAGFRMGPLELLDLTGLDVSHPVMESIYNQFYQEPRYKPSPLTRQMLVGGRLGRKTGHGFYQYENGQVIHGPQPQPLPSVHTMPPLWIAAENHEDYERLSRLVIDLGADLESAAQPSPQALCLLAPYGRDATSACVHFDTDPARTLCIDLLTDLARHRTLMQNPLTAPAMRDAAHALLAADGVGVTVISDSVGFVAQRTLAMVVNLACDIAQQRIASVEDIDQAVQLGLGYPQGPLAWGDALGPRRMLTILQRMSELTHDPRYRPSPWLRRRAMLGVSLRHEEPTVG